MPTTPPPPDRESIHLRRVEGGRQQTYGGRLDRCPDEEGVLEASFALETAPAVRIGQHVELCYLEGESAVARAFLAQVVMRRLGSTGVSYRFRAKSRARDGQALDFSRRAADRVHADDATAESLKLSLDEQDAYIDSSALLLDLSETGAQAQVPLALEAELYASDRLRLSFRLTGDDAPCELVALVRWRKLDGGDVRYGLQFLPETPDFAHKRARIAAYVATRIRSYAVDAA